MNLTFEGARNDKEEAAEQLLRFLQHRGRANDKQPEMVAKGADQLISDYNQFGFSKVLT